MPRRWFQIHLSTAVVLMFVAGGLLWRNITPRHVAWYDPMVYSHGQERFHQRMLNGELWMTGWPMVMSMRPVDPNVGHMEQHNVYGYLIIVSTNLLSGMIILFACSIPLEFLIRRREVRKL